MEFTPFESRCYRELRRLIKRREVILGNLQNPNISKSNKRTCCNNLSKNKKRMFDIVEKLGGKYNLRREEQLIKLIDDTFDFHKDTFMEVFGENSILLIERYDLYVLFYKCSETLEQDLIAYENNNFEYGDYFGSFTIRQRWNLLNLYLTEIKENKFVDIEKLDGITDDIYYKMEELEINTDIVDVVK